MPINKSKISSFILPVLTYGTLMFFIYLMVLITMQYIPINFNVAFLISKQEEIKSAHYRIAFFTHVYSAIFVLFFGMFQFSEYIRKRCSRIHLIFGKLYVGILLFFAAPSGFIIGWYGNGGLSSIISFCLLAVLWFYFTLMAYISIRKRQFQKHENYMILSYALTLSAVSLRLFKMIIVNSLALPPMDTYRIVVWLGWIFNLTVALLIIAFNRNKKRLNNRNGL